MQPTMTARADRLPLRDALTPSPPTIGLPLGVLGLLWVHTQRVPGAKTHPPRPVWIGLTLALLVLSLVKPALSGPPADLAATPTTIPLDWFYLPVYPLIYAWSPGAAWALVGST